MTEKLYRISAIMDKHEYPCDLPPKVESLVVIAETRGEAMSKAAQFVEEELYCSNLDELCIIEESYLVR